MLPFAYPGGDLTGDLSRTSLLHIIVESGNTSLCDNATLRTLVQYKWQTYGRNLFKWEAASYLCGLLLLMILLFSRTDPSAQEESLSIRTQVVAVVTVLVLLDSLWNCYRELSEVSRITLERYLKEDWKNYIDLIVIVLS
jgi:hypothetical protein